MQRLLDEQGIGQRADAIPRRPDPGAPGPLSWAQQRLYFFDQVDRGSALYVVAGMLRMRGEVDLAILRESVEFLVGRHEALRTGFEVGTDGNPVQVVYPPDAVRVELPLHECDEAELPDRVREICSQPIDLRDRSLLRPVLFRLGDHAWALLLCVHHIVVDGWSMEILAEELGTVYSALRGGGRPRLAPPPTTYLDFALWQREGAPAAAAAEQLRYWQAKLAGLTPLELLGDEVPAGTPPFAGASLPMELAAGLVSRVRAAARAEDATLFMALVAAWSVVLARWTGDRERSDVVLGAAVAGRTRPELEGVVGFFVNTLPLRVDVSGEPTFRELLRRAREVCLAAYAHQDVPFEQIVRDIQPERDVTGRSPIVRHMLVLHNTPRAAMRLPGLDVTVEAAHTGSAKFDMEIELTPAADGGLSGFMEYATARFTRAAASRMVGALGELLEAVAVDMDIPVWDLPVMAADDRAVVQAFSTAVPAPTGEHADVVAWFESVVDRSPDEVAVVTDGTVEAVTYAELDARANRLAGWLRDGGAGHETRVGVCLRRGADLLVAVLGVLKAGAAFLPLDPGYPAGRLRGILEDGAAALVLTDSSSAESLAGQSPVVPLDELWPRLAARSADRPGVRPFGSGAAYVVFTSGSTGRPKGAVNTHDALVNRLRWARDRFGIGPSDVVVHKTPLGFDVAVWELLLPLATGARLVLAKPGAHGDPDYLWRLFQSHGVTMTHFVPSMLRAFLDAGPVAVPRLRRVISSGEELTPRLASDFRDRLPDVELHNLYGPAEAAIDVTAARVSTPIQARIPIGPPVPGVELHVLDHRMRAVPVGVPGELFIGGVQVARGYVGRPGMTAQRFVANPFEPGQRVYATGDRVRWRPDGALEFLGRLDQQVKIRGQRVEPGEAEVLLRAHPRVADALVLADRDLDGEVQLIAYVKPVLGSVAGAGEHVSRWTAVFDENYTDPGQETEAAEDPTFDIAGWTSSYTGEPIPAEQMRDWVDGTVGRVLGLPHEDVLEIGCGTGLLLFRIAPHTRSYRGTDVSAVPLRKLAARLPCLGHDADRVTLREAAADDFDGIGDASVDLVLLNSVAQYFPSADYLISVLDQAVRATRPGGAIMLGDVRSKSLAVALHTSVQLSRMPAEASLDELWDAVRLQLDREEELLIDPGLFRSFASLSPEVSSVSVLPKQSRYPNELTKFRYDVVLRIGAGPGPDDAEPSWPGQRALAMDLRAVEFARAAAEGRETTVTTVGALRAALDDDVAVPPAAAQPVAVGGASGWHRFTNDPLRATLASQVRGLLRERLPDYFVPAHVLLVDSWPVGPNGKLDRAALPRPAGHRPVSGYVAARTETELLIAAIWSDVLGLERVGIHDRFFDLGGHSLLATRVVFHVRAACQVDLELGEFLAADSVAALAALVDARPKARPVAPIPRRDRSSRRIR
nr:non-ribosomal peptide synthetase [Kibdelosporangium sp. MJ126-NF4]CTQ99022.1 Non-ribosomal peptide synthetase [Kibdelosporangium sp. MJ126-NF4]